MSKKLYSTGIASVIDVKVDGEGTFSGYGATFNNVDRGGDMILPGAFKKSLGQKSISAVKMLYQHDPSKPIGVWQQIEEDKKGLKVTGKLLLSVEKAKETYELMKAGVIDSLSIGYRTVKDAFDTTKNVRQLLELDLWEISCVTFPMNPGATVDQVKEVLHMPTRKELEAHLRNAGGFSREDSRKAASLVKALLRNGEASQADDFRNEKFASAFNTEADRLICALRSPK